MDVSRSSLNSTRAWWPLLGAIALVALALRLHGVHQPLLDHPGWRQGDTAAIARNFATLDPNPLHPQVDYDGPPPNYAELELQIVPYLASLLYRLFGIHEIFGRLISVGFSVATVVASAFLARRIAGTQVAGIAAALALALMPGSIYYGRTFMPDTAMVFFLVAALLLLERTLARDPLDSRALAGAGLAMAVAVLAKPVAAVAVATGTIAIVARLGLRSGTLRAIFYAALAFVPYALYDRAIAAIAEWHFASGITRLHVLPSLVHAFASPAGFAAKWNDFIGALAMLPGTMVGPPLTALALAGIAIAPRGARALLWSWLAFGLAYAYVVVTVERVDYYLALLMPLAALGVGVLADAVARRIVTRSLRIAAVAAAAAGAAAIAISSRAIVRPYYAWKPVVYVTARSLDRTLVPGALVVMGHLDPSILYYINRKGWEEDPLVWTPFDEESAIKKGARYYIAVEPKRLARNRDLSMWLQRFPAHDVGPWTLYETDPARTLPGAEERWRAYRRGVLDSGQR